MLVLFSPCVWIVLSFPCAWVILFFPQTLSSSIIIGINLDFIDSANQLEKKLSFFPYFITLPQHTYRGQRSEHSLWGSVLSVHHMGPWGHNQVIRLGDKSLYLLSEQSQQPPLRFFISSQIKTEKLIFLRFSLLCSIFCGIHYLIVSFIFYCWVRRWRVAQIAFKITIQLSQGLSDASSPGFCLLIF